MDIVTREFELECEECYSIQLQQDLLLSLIWFPETRNLSTYEIERNDKIKMTWGLELEMICKLKTKITVSNKENFPIFLVIQTTQCNSLWGKVFLLLLMSKWQKPKSNELFYFLHSYMYSPWAAFQDHQGAVESTLSISGNHSQWWAHKVLWKKYQKNIETNSALNWLKQSLIILIDSARNGKQNKRLWKFGSLL